MNSNCGRRFVLAIACVLIVTQLSWAQVVKGSSTGGRSLASIAQTAQQTGQPQPVAPASMTPAGHHRPFVWVSRQLASGTSVLTAKGTPAIGGALPWFCNFFSGSVMITFCPNALQIAYGTSSIAGANGGAGITIGIVDAYHYASADSDLSEFSSTMGLPQCTIASGCFQQLNEYGGTSPTASADSGWELETMLDLEWAHAMAPNAKLVLVEGDTPSFGDLGQALATAAALADIVSNSYGTTDFVGESTLDSLYNVGKPLLFASGDYGAPAIYPCTSHYATCIGGTTLYVNAAYHRTLEAGWSGSGGGCSVGELDPGFQSGNGVNACSGYRSAPDVAAIADPGTGVIVLDSGNGGWWLVGGTSVATPVTAGIYADMLAARVHFGKSKNGSFQGFLNYSLYNAFARNPAYFYYDVTVGNNGHPATAGYDLVTGLGVLLGAQMANPFFGLVFY